MGLGYLLLSGKTFAPSTLLVVLMGMLGALFAWVAGFTAGKTADILMAVGMITVVTSAAAAAVLLTMKYAAPNMGPRFMRLG